MKKIIILIPVYNDWKSVIKLLDQLNETLEEYDFIEVKCIIVNDASTVEEPKLTKPKNIHQLKIMNMKKNRGHARCNAFGIRYVTQKEEFDYLILMDGDGEDRPIEIKSFINEILQEPEKSVVAKRVKRSEGVIFQYLYFMHKIITYIFTGKKINFGNYSCLTKKDASTINAIPSLWSSYSGTIKKNLNNLREVDSIRGERYFGPSKMSLFKLIIHSFSIIAVFKYQVFLRSILIILLLIWLNTYLGDVSLILIFLVIAFNFIILIVSFREKKKDLLDSHNNLKNIKEITH